MEVIGYTTGVFDLFHIGHLRLLERAKQECDLLVVGVTTDELCFEWKSIAPVIPEHERMEIVRAIRWVDVVVAQDDMNKFAAWRKIGFHRMFVGDDWKGTDIWNGLEARFKEYGVEIIYFPYTRHICSTSLRIT